MPPDGKPKPYEQAGLAALERGNHGPHKHTIGRLIATIRHLEEQAERFAWESAEKQAQLDAASTSRQRCLIVVDCDGFIQVYADAKVSVKVTCLRPWDDQFELMVSDKTHWSEIWSAEGLRATAMPNYLSAPNRVMPEEMAAALEWYERTRVHEALKEFKGRHERADIA